ncbi:MAG: ABC transporter ATP-binding protein [Cytophagales bacterium]|nr:ABC transporter ATP-binding protein [Cytophagales bacterium]
MLHAQQLSFGYKPKKLLFDRLDLSISPGSIVGLLGKNGMGKTTLLKLFAGMHFPKNGSLDIFGERPQDRSPHFLEDIYFLPEEIEAPSFSPKTFISCYRRFYPRFDTELMQSLTKEFELPETSNISKWSYGQKKKFHIAFALSTKCRLLLFDEPTNGLDISSKAIFRKIMAGSLDENQLVVISTHQVADIQNLIDRVLILDSGKIILNEELYEIESQYHFGFRNSLRDEDILYAEETLGGYKVVAPRRDESSTVDLELLFNASIQNKLNLTPQVYEQVV